MTENENFIKEPIAEIRDLRDDLNTIYVKKEKEKLIIFKIELLLKLLETYIHQITPSNGS